MSHHLPWPWARIQAHRGAGKLAPENTLAAIRRGHAMGFRAIEIDARLSRDEVPVVIHDRTLERTTDGAGAVAETMAADIARLDAGNWFAPEYRGERVPTLAEVIAWCRAQGVWMNLEIKRYADQNARIGEVVACTAARCYGDLLRPGGDRAENVVVQAPLLSSFGRDALLAARRAAPDLPRGYLVDAVPANWRDELEKMGCVSLHTDHETLTRDKARAVKEAGYWLFCYTVNDAARARRLRSWGVDAFCTDRIDLIGPDFA